MTTLLNRREVSKMVLGLAAGTAALGFALPGQAAMDAAGLLRQADAIRNPQSSFVVDVDLKNYEGRALTGHTKVRTHSRVAGGQFQTIVYITDPAADRGKILLRNGNNLWLYDPASRSSVRISARQRLLGNASNGDVVSSNLVGDYAPEMQGAETIADGDRRNRDCHKLYLTSRDRSTPYSAVEFWVDAANARPVKAKFYTGSGSLIKAAWYRNYSNQMGAQRPTEVVIADGFDPNKVTVMSMSGYSGRDLPASWFTKEWLPRFSL
jgi:outer membrane lipoprotein-sorting protein